MKKGNFLIWALSLVIAAVLWGYVAFYVNQEDVKTVTDIPIEFINETALSSRDWLQIGGQNTTVNVRFTGPIQNLVNIRKDTVTAVVDLKGVRSLGENLLTFELRGPSDIYNTEQYHVTPLVSVTIDRIISKYVDLRFDFSGEVAEGYVRELAVFTPSSRVQITGPATVLDTVYEAVVSYAPHDPLSRSVTDLPVDYALYTESGLLVESEYIEKDYLWMTIPVHMVKTVPLVINFIEGGGLLEKHISYLIEPESVRISGDPERLADINSIPIAQIDLASLLGDLTETYTIRYPDDIRNLDYIDTAEASIHITGALAREISTINIVTKGLELPEGYTYILLTKPVAVVIRGPEEDVSRVEAHNVRLVADFTGAEVEPGGRYGQTATVEVIGFDRVGVVDKKYEIIIEIVPLTENPP